MNALTTATPSDWPAFYRTTALGGSIPFRPVYDFRPKGAVVSDLYLSLADVLAKAKTAGCDGALITLFADVVRIDVPVSLALAQGGLTIAARRIEYQAPITVDFTGATDAGLFFVAQAWTAPLTVTITDQAGQRSVDLTPPDGFVGAGITVDGGTTSQVTIPALQASFDWDTPLRRSLTAILQYGTACFDTQPAVAGEMFAYVYRVTSGVDEATDLHAQAAGLIAALRANDGTAVFVPYLSKDLYERQAQAFADAAMAYETQYQVYAGKADDAKARADAAKLMLDHYADTAEFNAKLLDQANQNYADSQSAVITAGFAVTQQRAASDNAAITFDYAIKIWAREKAIEAAFEIIGAITSVIASVAAVCATEGAAAPEAGKAVEGAAKAGEEAAKAAKAGEEAAKAAKAVEAAGTAAKAAEKISGAMETISKAIGGAAKELGKIKDQVELTAKLFETLPQIINAIEASNDAQALAKVDMPTNPQQTGDADWDAFVVDFTSMMKAPIDGGVDGAQEYLDAMTKLAIYSKSSIAAQQASVAAAQEVLRLTLQQKVDTLQQARIQTYLGKQSDDASAAAALGDIFFARQLSMRLWLFLAVAAYANAYRYWALRPSSVKPSMITPISQLKDDLARIQQEYGEALSSFKSPPQDFAHLKIVIDENTPGYAGVVAALRSQRKAVVTIGMNEPAFRGLGRVRLNTMRVWLKGVPADAAPVTVDISTAGYFQDRLGGQTFSFNAAPMQRSFRYQGPMAADSSIQLDGSVEVETRYCLFQPTPFSQWQIAVDDVDLSGLTGIVLEFAGSAIRDLGH